MSASWAVEVHVMPRPGVADPQGATIERALPLLGYGGVAGVRVGKRIELTVEAPDRDEARARALAMCERLLANPVIETFDVRVGPAPR